MTDINELREKITIKGLDVVADTDILAVLDRLEAAEKERDDLRTAVRHESDCVEAAKAEIKALRAKIEQKEQQEPIAYMPLVTVAQLESGGSGVVWCPHDRSASDVPVYALPGAQTQPAPSIPDDVMRDAKRYRFLRAAKNIPISTEAARDPIVYDAAIDAAMLAAATEAKP